jgi:hypothetical protein
MSVEPKGQILKVIHSSTGSDVRPVKWEDVIDLYDDGEYSAIWGRYGGTLCLGVRWNGTEGKCGFPNQEGNPLQNILTALRQS